MVPTYERTESDISVLNDIRLLSEFTISTLNNEKHFPKRDRWILSKPIMDNCIEVVILIRKIYSIEINSEEDYNLCLSYKRDAYACLEVMLSLIELAYLHLKLDGNKVEHWTELILNTETNLEKWNKFNRA